MQMTAKEAYTALAVVERLPPAILEYVGNRPVNPRLIAKAIANGCPAWIAEPACGVLQRCIEHLEEAGASRRGTIRRTKPLELAIDACREPVASALRLGMMASPTDGRALLRLWTEVCDPHERGRMMDMLRQDCNIS